MKVKLVIDVNLSPGWVAALAGVGRQSAHWATIGDPRASDHEIMAWARDNDYVVFTHDLDFGTMLALTHANGPSVVQLRAQDVLPENLLNVVASAIDRHGSDLERGALLVVDEARARMRLLPL